MLTLLAFAVILCVFFALIGWLADSTDPARGTR